jgi:hypothetical protein
MHNDTKSNRNKFNKGITRLEYQKFKTKSWAWWVTPVILGTWEIEIVRIAV